MNSPRLFGKLFSSLLLSLVWSGDAVADVIVVDATGGPGADFLEIQPAVDAAQHGDTILVSTGTYPGFGIHGKGISVVAAAGAQVDLVSEIAVRNLALGRQVSLVGLDVTPLASAQRGLVAANNAGPLWVEDCHLNGSSGRYLGNGYEDHAQPGVLAVDCEHLVFLRCVVFGGNGLDWGEDSDTFLSWGPGWGGAGVEALRSQVSVFGGRLRGGWGGSNDDGGANNGGHGIQLSDDPECFAFLEGTRLVGGAGGVGGWSGGFGTNCGDGGRGGHCIYAPGSTTAFIRDTLFVPGIGGSSTSSYCSAGPNGQNFAPANHPIVSLGGSARTMSIESPVAQAGSALLEVQCSPGDLIWAQVALDLDPAYLPAIEGQRLIGLPRRLVFLGTAAANGSFQKQMPMPTLSNPFGSWSTHLQGYFRDTTGSGHLGSGGHLLVLGSGY